MTTGPNCHQRDAAAPAATATKALIVEDSGIQRELLKRYLDALRIPNEEAADGRQAIDLLQADRSRSIGLALVDWKMPHMDGIEFLRQLRARPEFDHVKVMMVTVCNDPRALESALRDGANEFLMKPYDQQMVTHKLRILGMLN